MAYCTVNDILTAVVDRNITLYTDDDGAGEPDLEVVGQAITSASALVDSYISGRYGAGLSPVPELIKSVAVDISIYKITSRSGSAPEEFRTWYEDAVRLLERIQSGKADIPGTSIDDETGTTEPEAAVVSAAPLFSGSGEGMKGF